MSGRNLTVLIVLLLAVFLASQSLYVIKETERGVLLRFGEVVNPNISPGLHVKWPLANSVRKVDGRVLTVDSSAERFFTQEQKALIVDSYAKFRVDDSSKFYRATGFDEGRVRSLLAQRINDGLRNQVAIRTIQEVVSGERDELMEILTKQVALTAEEELGVELIDVRVKRIDLPREVSESVYRRMNAEREKEAREHRAQGRELAEGIRAAADREVTVIEANAYQEAQQMRGEGDAEATAIYAQAFNRDPEFYAFTRSLQAYRDSFHGGSDILLLQPNSEFFRYLKDSQGGTD